MDGYNHEEDIMRDLRKEIPKSAKNYKKYRSSFDQFNYRSQIRMMMFFAFLLFTYATIGLISELRNIHLISKYTYISYAGTAYFIFAGIILYMINRRYPKYITMAAYINVAVILCIMEYAIFVMYHYLGFTIIYTIIVSLSVTVFGPFIYFASLMAGFAGFNFLYHVITNVQPTYSVHFVLYAIDLLILISITIFINTLIFESKHKEFKKIDSLIHERDMDGLTNILNRTAAERYISQYDGSDGLHAMIILDVDDFKSINDTMGHTVGDLFLIQTASILQSIVRSSDCVARLGGDEFLIFLPHITSEVIEEKVKTLINLFQLIGKDFNNTSCSAGVSFSNQVNPDHLFQNMYQKADENLYAAKKDGKARFRMG